MLGMRQCVGEISC